MLNFIKKKIRHLKQTRPKLYYEGAHEGYVLPKMSVSDSVQALEPRIMFDAAGVATGVEVAVDNVAEQQAQQALTPENLQAQAANQENEENEKVVEALADLVPPAGRNEIIFVDKGVADYASLISEISGDAELIFIDANSDGLEQIANALHGRNDIDAIHIVSHGESGELFLGNTTLTKESIQGEHADELATIKSALSEQADLLIYGCNFAEGELGKAAAIALAEATGADVAASEDITGAESLGGDWDLEFISGDIGTVTLNAETYEGILFAPTDLTFIESTEVTGDGDTDGELGEVFRFHDVSGDGIDDVTPAAGSIDAIITITDLSYIDSATGLAIGTDTPILEDWDRPGSGALDPVLDARTITGGAIQGSEISATFTIQYVLADTNTSVSVDSFVSPIDIDSSANLREAVSVTAPVVSVIQNSPTTLTTELTHENGLTTIALEQATLNNHNPGVTNTPEFAAMFQVQQADIFTVQIRSIIEGATPQTGERLFSLSFSETSFTTANTLSVPIVDLDLNDSSGATDLDYQNTTPYQAGDPAISIVDSDVTITDSDPNITDMQSANITLTNAQAGDVLTVGTLPTGITATGSGTDTITLSGVASIADYQDALKAITYSNTNPTTISGVDRTIEVTINNGDIDSPVATATIDVFGTPTVDTQTTTNTQPTITGTWDINNGSATGLQVTVNGTTYTLGTDPALTTDANGNWSLNLSTAGQTLPVATYNVSVSTTDGTNTVVDETTNELTVILNPEWSFTGDVDVLEGDSATYTLSLVGAESISTGQTVAVQFNTAGTATEGSGATDDYDLNQALINAAASRTELSYVSGSFELVYTSPGTPAAFSDLTITVTTNTDGDTGPENYDLTLTAGTGTATSTVSTTANTVNTTIYDSLTAPTLTATPDGTTNFTEGDTSKDLFDSVVITNPETTQTIEEIVFDVVDAVDGANEVLNIDGVAIPMTAGTGTTASGYTYTVTDNGGNDFTVTLTTTGASSAAIQTLVDDMSYRNNLVDTPTAGDRTVTIESITDSGASNNQTTGINITETITVVPVNDAPVVNAPVLPLPYTAGMDIHGTGFTAADIDAGAASNLVVTLSSNDGNITVAAGNSGLGSITGNGSPTVTLTGTITQIDNFLKGNTTGTINYTTLNGVPGDDTFTVSVNDMGNTGGGNLTGSNSVVINTTGNTAPVLDLDANNSTATGNDYAATFTEGGSAVNIADSDTSLTDTESDDVTLQIVAGNIADGANEILNFGTGQILLDGTNDATLNNQTVNGVVVDVFYDASAQTITISDQDGNALTLTEATDVLEGITYQNDSNNPSTGTARTFTITADDGDTSNSAVSTINIGAVNDPPTVTDAGATVTFNESDSPVVIDNTLTVSDLDDTNIESATISITGGFVSSEDVLDFTAAFGITGSYDSGTGVLSLTGPATLAQFESVLESVTYDNTNDTTPTGGNRTITWVVNDGDDNSAATTSTVNVVPVDDAPTLTNLDNNTWVEDTDVAPKVIDSNVTLADVDSDTITQITVQITGNYDNTEDVLAFAGDANFNAGVYDSGTGTLIITSTGASATVAQAEAALEAITYQNTDTISPTANTRTLTWTVTDGINTNSVVETSDIVVTSVNDAPDGTDNTVTTNEDIDHVFTAAEFGFTDVDTGDALSGVVITTLPSNGTLFNDANGNGVVDGGEAITAGSTISIADINNNQLKFKPVAEASGTPYTSFTFQVVDDSGAVNNTDTTPNTMTINVNNVNDPATVDLDGAGGTNDYSVTFQEGDAATTIVDTDVAIIDVDDTTLANVTLDVGGVVDGANEQLTIGDLTFALNAADFTNNAVDIGGNTYTVNWTAATQTAVITLNSGEMTIAQSQAVLLASQYQHTDTDNPTAGNRTIAVTVNDGDVDSAPATATITVEAINDAPVVGAPGSQLTYLETALNIHGTGFTVSDVDANAGILNVTLNVPATEGAINVTAGDSGVINITNDGTNNVTLQGTVTQINNLLSGAGTGTITYTGPGDTTLNTTFTVTVNDAGNTGTDPGLTGDGSSEEGTNSVVINLDADSDGIANINDIDDDNDGILDTEEGIVYGTTTSTITPANNHIDEETDNTETVNNTINLTSTGLQVGDTVTISNVEAEGDLDGATETFSLSVGATSLGTGLQTGNQYSGSYDPLTTPITPTEITLVDLGGGQVGFVITSVTEPAVNDFDEEGFAMRYRFDITYNSTTTNANADTDGDGIVNRLDLDSDNDGISDLIESGYTPTGTEADDGTISLAEADVLDGGAGDGDQDNDGLMDVFDANTGGVAGSNGTTPASSDADGIADFLDLDSDNDGIADAIEAQTTAGYTYTGTDSDNDGVVDSFDSGSGFGGNFSTPQDTDGDGTADYLDTDSDNDTKLDSAESGLTLSGTDANQDGIDDDASIGASYADPDGVINTPSSDLANEVGGINEVAYREVGDTDQDGILDTVDIDDDNDGILDTVEDNVTVDVVNITQNTPGAYSQSSGAYVATGDGQLTITIVGGDGGGSNTRGGQGATVTATFNVSQGDVIEYVVAEGSAGVVNGSSAGGGGATGLFINDVLVMVAGGGGGGDNSGGQSGLGGQATQAGASGTGSGHGDGGGAPGGGAIGDGGEANPGDAAGGGGINSAGGSAAAVGGAQADTDATDGVTFVAGGAGAGGAGAGGGGFAGGGGADQGSWAGGGGGYSGGGAAGDGGRAGGGGSFVNTSAAVGYVSSTITAGTDGGGGLANSNGNDGSVNISGNLSIKADTDGDGIIDSLDLDSDNDGISDLYESTGGTGDALADTNNDGMISLAESVAAGASGDGDIDNDGLMDIFDADTADTSSAASMGNTPVNTDGDSRADHLDLDSDSDGIADVIEAQTTAGYTYTGTDSDSDGIVDSFDTASPSLGGSFSTPQDTDGDGTADYLDTDSDNDSLLDSAESGLTISGTDVNNDGIDDDASIGASYADPDGVINTPLTDLNNTDGAVGDVDYRDDETPLTITAPANNVQEDGTTTGTITISTGAGHDALASITIDGNTYTVATLTSGLPVSFTTSDEGGLFTITGYTSGTGVINYSYDPAGTSTDHSGGAVVDTLTISTTDVNGDTNTAVSTPPHVDLNITINDTTSTANADTNTATEGGSAVAGNVITTGPGADTLGADTPTTVTAADDNGGPALTVDGVTVNNLASGATIVIATDGSYTYTPPPVGSVPSGGITDVINYTITDSDGDTSSSTLTITVDPLPVFVLTGDTSVTEGGTASYTITVTGAAITAGQTVVIDIDTVNGTALNPADFGDLQNASYNTTTGQLTVTGPFAIGATVATLTVDTVNDTLLESDETFGVNITTATVDGNTVSVTDNVGNVTITDNDTANASLSVTQHGDEAGSVSIVYTVTLDKVNNTGSAITFDIADTGGTATSGSDHAAIPGGAQISVAAGASTGTYTVTVTDDALVEGTETLQATISNSSNADVTIATASATANIADNATTSPPSSDSDDDFVYDENVNADKIPPVESDPGENSDRELSADGAVLDAVSDASSLGSTRALDADGAVLDAVEGANSSTIYFGDTISGELADNVGLWDISGVKGFAVSFSLSETTQGSETDLSLFPLRIATPEAENRDHLLIKSILRDRTLFLEIDYVNSNTDLITVSNISILQVDGNPLPEWLRIDDEGGLVSGEPPVGTETIELRIEVTLSNDTAIIRYIDVNVSSGEIAALEKVGNEFIAGASLFDQQIEEEAVKFENSSEDIKKSFIN